MSGKMEDVSFRRSCVIIMSVKLKFLPIVSFSGFQHCKSVKSECLIATV